VAGDVAAHVGVRDTGLVAERRDDRVVDVGGAHSAGPEGECEVDTLAGLAVEHPGLLGADGLPGFDGFSQQWVDGFGEGCAGLLSGHVEQADGVTGEDFGGVSGDRHSVVLPADAAHAQAGDLVAAQPAEQPGHRHSPDKLHRVAQAVGVDGEVFGLDVEAGGQQFGPDVISDHPGVRADQGMDAAWCREGPDWVETPPDPLPLLQVTEERPGRGEIAGLRARRQRRAEACGQPGLALDVLTDGHTVDGRDPVGAELTGPLLRIDDLGVLGDEPSAEL
jgi:hypothetical protein